MTGPTRLPTHPRMTRSVTAARTGREHPRMTARSGPFGQLGLRWCVHPGVPPAPRCSPPAPESLSKQDRNGAGGEAGNQRLLVSVAKGRLRTVRTFPIRYNCIRVGRSTGCFVRTSPLSTARPGKEAVATAGEAEPPLCDPLTTGIREIVWRRTARLHSVLSTGTDRSLQGGGTPLPGTHPGRSPLQLGWAEYRPFNRMGLARRGERTCPNKTQTVRCTDGCVQPAVAPRRGGTHPSLPSRDNVVPTPFFRP